MKKNRFGIAVLLVGVLLMACSLPDVIVSGIDNSPAGGGEADTGRTLPGESIILPTAIPTEPAETCLAGTWEISGIHEYVLAAIPREMAEEYNLEYKGTNGNAYFILTPDGEVVLQADGLEIVLEAQASIFTVPVTASVDGEAVGRYTANEGILTTTDMDTSGLTASAQAMGQELVNPTQIIGAIPLLQPPANSAEYSCDGDTLSLRIGAYPASIPPLVFKRK